MSCQSLVLLDNSTKSQFSFRKIKIIGTCSFTCQGTSAKKQRRNLFDLRVKLPPVTTCTQR